VSGSPTDLPGFLKDVLEHPRSSIPELLGAIASLRGLVENALTPPGGGEWNLPLVGSGSLDLESRRGDTRRSFRHVDQNAQIAALHMKLGSYVKLAMLIDGFTHAVQHDNSLVEYAAGRSAIELLANSHTIRSRLYLTVAACTPQNWTDCGEKFYGITIRALFGTRDRERQQQLISTGRFPKRRVEPFSVMDSIDALAKEPGFESLRQRYETLCDYVHHNGASLAMSQANRFTAAEAAVGDGAKIVLPGETHFATYTDPSKRQRERGEELIRNATWLDDALWTYIYIYNTPDSPYPPPVRMSVIGDEGPF
jgi:hypothetical protein